MSEAPAFPLYESASERRGVLASYGTVTPARTESDVTKFRITLRDAIWMLAGCLAMYGAALAAQLGTRSDIRDWGTRFESYQLKQQDTNSSFQRQLDEIRRESALNRVDVEDARKENAELKGILLGAGIRGAQKP